MLNPSVLARLVAITLVHTATLAPCWSDATVSTTLDWSTTSSTIHQEFCCEVDVRLYDPVDLGSLTFAGENDLFCESAVEGAVVNDPPGFFWHLEGLPEGFRGPATILRCSDCYDEFECQPQLFNFRSSFVAFTATDAQGNDIPPPKLCAERLDCEAWTCEPEGPYFADVCGDVDGDRTITSPDALGALQAATGQRTCAPTVCDVDRSGTTTAKDALAILIASVGGEAELVCTAPC